MNALLQFILYFMACIGGGLVVAAICVFFSWCWETARGG